MPPEIFSRFSLFHPRQAELLAIIDRLTRENEALRRENERLKQGEVEGQNLKQVRSGPSLLVALTGRQRLEELEKNSQSATAAQELDQLRERLAEAEKERQRLQQYVFLFRSCLSWD